MLELVVDSVTVVKPELMHCYLCGMIMRSRPDAGSDKVLIFDPGDMNILNSKLKPSDPFAHRLMDCCSDCLMKTSKIYRGVTPIEALRLYTVSRIMGS